MIQNLLWRLIARAVTTPAVADRVIQQAQRTPYSHILSMDGSDVYMYRWWLFNPYRKDAAGEVLPPRFRWLPSIRVHHIIRPDIDRHLHDHPWNARTIVMRGAYVEERIGNTTHVRLRGYTGRLLFGEYHRITQLSSGGVFTLFFTWRKRGTWGYLVDGGKVPHREYWGGLIDDREGTV